VCLAAQYNLSSVLWGQVQQACELFPLQIDTNGQALIPESVPHAQQVRVPLHGHSARLMWCSTWMLAKICIGCSGGQIQQACGFRLQPNAQAVNAESVQHAQQVCVRLRHRELT